MSKSSKVHLIGNAHLDPIWLWRWQEGCGEVLQTFRSALDRLNEYDDFVFTCSSAAYYKWVEDIDPDMFAEITERVKEGRWVPVNGWWVQPDCNMPSGEAFARQALYSQLYYYEKFGKICTTGYNVDSFGHSAMLPQLLLKGGMTNYVFQRPSEHENPNIPVTFIWESADGSKVLTSKLPLGYAANGKKALDGLMDYSEKLINESGYGMMLFYGVGNHGGGPTKADIEYLKENMVRDGWHTMKFSSPDEYFKALTAEFPDLPVWKDDLQHHASGCYSATSMVKKLNRTAENLLFAAEAFSSVANKQYGMTEKTEDFKTAWREVCFNQFHDILCGCSIMEAYDDVRDSMGHAMNIASKIYNEAVLRIARKIDTWIDGVSDPVCTETRNHDCGRFPRPVVVFNPHSFDIELPVRTYNASSSVKDSDGNDVAFQNVRSSRSNDSHLDTCFIAKVPALGYSTYWLTWLRDDDKAQSISSDVKASGLTIENKYIKAVFSDVSGSIISLVNKENGYDYASEMKPVAVPTVIDDHETDTWAHNVFTFHNIKGIMELENIELVENGPARAVVRVKHHFGESHLSQDFILGANSKTLRVKCKAMWQEKFTLLKMSFPVDGTNTENTYEIPAGIIKRPTNGEEEPVLRWGAISFDTDGERRTLGIINDSKYSYDCPENDLRITLLRNVIFADHYSPRPAADFNFTDEGKSTFEYGIFMCDGEVNESGIVNEAALFNIRPVAVPESYHKGTQPQKKSFISCDKDNVIMTAFKLCDDGSGDVIMRFYETSGKETHVNIVCDMLECGFKADFGAYEIKTFRINSQSKVFEENFLEGCDK